MTPYLALLLGLLLLSVVLAGLGLMIQKPGEVKPRRPLPMPEEVPPWVHEGQHRDDGETRDLSSYC